MHTRINSCGCILRAFYELNKRFHRCLQEEAEQKLLVRRAARKMIAMLVSGSLSSSGVKPTPSPCSRLHWKRP